MAVFGGGDDDLLIFCLLIFFGYVDFPSAFVIRDSSTERGRIGPEKKTRLKEESLRTSRDRFQNLSLSFWCVKKLKAANFAP